MINKLENIISPEEEWDNLKQEIGNFVIRTQNYAKEKIGNSWGKWWSGKIVEFGNKITANIPDYKKYITWHMLIGSSTEFEISPKLDLPEPYSVKSFIQKCVKELDNL